MDFASIPNLLNKIISPLVTFVLGFSTGFLAGFLSRLAYDWYNQPILRLNPSGFFSFKKDTWMYLPATRFYLSITNIGRTSAANCSAQITLNDIDSSMCVLQLNVCIPTRFGTQNQTIIPHIQNPEFVPIKSQGLCWASNSAGNLTLNPHLPENLEFCQVIEHTIPAGHPEHVLIFPPAEHVLIFPTESSYTVPRVGLVLEKFKALNKPQINASLTVGGENVRTPLKVNLTIKFVEDYKNIKFLPVS